MIVLGILPLVVVAGLAAAIWSPSSRSPIRADIRLAVVAAYVCATAICALCTEVLGAFAMLHAWVVRALWMVAALTVAIRAGRAGRLRAFWSTLWARLAGSPFASMAIALATTLCVTAALRSPPNNHDSLSYHLARMESWIAHRSLENFPTANLRQLEFGPLHSIVLLNVKVLSNSDVLLNAVQLVALLLVVIPAASWIAERLGTPAGVRQVMVVAIATTPMVVLQASSTQNDLLVSGFLLAVIVFAWALLRQTDVPSGICLGLAVGCAIATKGTALVFGLPIALWWLWHARRCRIRSLVAPSIVAGVAALAMCLGYLARNHALSGSLLGESSRWNQPGSLSMSGTAATLLKNVSLQMMTCSGAINGGMEKGVRLATARILGRDADDPDTNFAGGPFAVPSRWRHEDYAGNPLQLGLIAIAAMAGPVVWLRRRKHRVTTPPREGAGLGWVLVGGLLLFSTVLTWQQWGNRLMTPLASLGVIWSASRFVREPPRWMVGAGCGAVLMLGAPWLLLNESRPVLGRHHSIFLRPWDAQWFSSTQEQGDFDRLREQLTRHAPRTVGFHFDGDTAEYPIARFLREQPVPREFRHIGVDNRSAALNHQNSPVDLVISNLTNASDADFESRHYVRVWSGSLYALYKPSDSATAPHR